MESIMAAAFDLIASMISAGISPHIISEETGVSLSSIYRIINKKGGLRPATFNRILWYFCRVNDLDGARTNVRH